MTAARQSPLVAEIASTGPWHYKGAVRTWHLFKLVDAPVVSGLATEPNVVTTLGSKQSWQDANVQWWVTPSRWHVALAQSGPASWPRIASPTATKVVALPKVSVTRTTVGVSSVAFHVDRVGVPVVVRMSYYPRWRATGATGPFRISPNLMVVVPTAHDVELTYGSSSVTTVGAVITLGAALVAVATVIVARRRRRGASH